MSSERQAGLPRIPGSSANDSRLRSNPHDPEGASSMGGRRRSSSTDSVHRQPFRVGSLRTHHRRSATNLSAFETCNTTPQSLAERNCGALGWQCAAGLVDHVIVLNERHLRRLLREYVRYYHEDRTHLGLGKDTPDGRVAASPPSSGHKVISLPRLGGLHHRYTVAA